MCLAAAPAAVHLALTTALSICFPFGSRCLHAWQEESIEHVASTIQRMLQEDAAAGSDAAAAAAERASDAGCGDAEQQQLGAASGDDGAGAGAAEAAQPGARGRFRRLYLIAVSAAGKGQWKD